MNKSNKFFIVLGIVIGAFIIFAVIYRAIYSMETARSYQVNKPTAETRLLIATQGSPFKDRLVNQLIDSVENHPVYIRVKDISALPSVTPNEWHAILVIHTWEYSRAPEVVREFSLNWNDAKHILYFATSGDGQYKLQGVDAISGASKLDRAPEYISQILYKLEPLILPSPIDQNHIVH